MVSELGRSETGSTTIGELYDARTHRQASLVREMTDLREPGVYIT